MSRNGIVFIALVLFVAFIANTFLLIVGTMLTLGTIYKCLQIGLDIASSSGSPVTDQLVQERRDGYYTIRENNLPDSFYRVNEFLLSQLGVTGESHQLKMERFLALINVNDGSEEVPSYLRNAVVKKIMWEYSQVHGSLKYQLSGMAGISPELIMFPIPDRRLGEFHRFCMEQTL